MISSLLARETNWMETTEGTTFAAFREQSPYSLGKLIEWKLHDLQSGVYSPDVPTR